MPRQAGVGTLGTVPYPDALVPFRAVALLVLSLAVPPAAGQTLAADSVRQAGLAALAVGHDSLAAARLGDAARADRRSAPTHLAHALALVDRDRRASRRATGRALRSDPGLAAAWAARLRDLRRPPAARLYSMTDGRRATAARRLVALDSAGALGHLELAERSTAAFRFHRATAQARGLWGRTSWQARQAWRAYAAAETHLDALVRLDPRAAETHRLAARLALLADSVAAFDAAARRAVAARPWDGEALLRAAAAAWRLGDAERAGRLVRDGIERLGGASVRYTSPLRFVRPDDRVGWETDSLGWAEAFWAAGDARRLTPVNDRLAEHLTRMVEADVQFREPDRVHIPGWATDRGDTWVRYGRPLRTRWRLVPGEGEFELWTYPDFTLLFHDPWQGGRLEFASSAYGEDEVTKARDLANTIGERFDPLASRRTVQVPLLTSAFRGAGGRTDVVVGYGVPFVEVPDSAQLDAVVWATDGDGALLDEARRAGARIRGYDTVRWAGGRMWSSAAQLSVPPGPVAVHAETELSDGTVGLTRVEVEVPAFGQGFQMSDVLLASAVGDAADGAPLGAVVRGETWIQALPWAVARVDAALWVYAEMYGLALDGGASRFEIDAALTPVAPGGRLRRGLRRLLGRRAPPGVAAGTAAGGRTPDDAQALLLDISGQAPGRYRLTLTVRDLVAGTHVTRTRDLLLEPPRP